MSWLSGLEHYEDGCNMDTVAHEAQRIFKDKLIDDESKRQFDRELSKRVADATGSYVKLGGRYYTTLIDSEGNLKATPPEVCCLGLLAKHVESNFTTQQRRI